MKKLLLAGLPVLIIFMGLPLLVSLMVVMSTTAAAECRTQTNQTAPTELGDLGAALAQVGFEGAEDGLEVAEKILTAEARRRGGG